MRPTRKTLDVAHGRVTWPFPDNLLCNTACNMLFLGGGGYGIIADIFDHTAVHGTELGIRRHRINTVQPSTS